MSSEQWPASSQPPQENCAFCGTAIPPSGIYCPRCGAVKGSLAGAGVPPAGLRRLPPGYLAYSQTVRKRTPFRRALKTVSAYVVLSFLFQLALSIVVLVYGTIIVTPAIMEEWDDGARLFLVLPVIVTILTLSGSALLVYYYLLIAAILASCAYVFMKGARPFARELMMSAKSREHSIIFATIGLLFATLFISLVVALLANPSPDELPEPATTAEYLFMLANASVWEEIIVRVLMIGAPMLAIDLARRRWKASPKSYIIGGGFTLGVPEVSLLIASSAIFGIAHFTSGWGAWKILPATIGGLAFGYLFLRYGIAASITMHFGTDYLSMPVEVSDSFGLAVVTGIGVIVWAGFGMVFFVYYVVRIIEFLSGMKLLEPRPEPASTTGPWMYPLLVPPSQQYYGPWQTGEPPESPNGAERMHVAPPPQRPGAMTRYICPRCGSIEARWKDGRFECLRCGFLS